MKHIYLPAGMGGFIVVTNDKDHTNNPDPLFFLRVAHFDTPHEASEYCKFKNAQAKITAEKKDPKEDD